VSIRGFLMGAGFIGHQNKKNSEDGFTLIEALIALFVLTIGVLGMMTLQTNAIRGNYRASTMTIATNLASGELESLRSAPFNAANINPANSPYTRVDPATGYTVTWTVASVTSGPMAGKIKKINVTVTRPSLPPVQFAYSKYKDL